MRILSAIADAVPIRLLKRDLLFVIEQLLGMLDENRIVTLARQHGIRLKRDDGGIDKAFATFVRRADEGTLARLLVGISILLASSRSNPTSVLQEAARMYKVDTNGITAKVKQEFAAKAKAKEVEPALSKPRRAA